MQNPKAGSSNTVHQLFNSWNVNIKCIFHLPFATHRYLVDELTNGKHAKKMIYSRYAKFLKSVSNNRRPMLRGLLNEVKDNCQSVVGQNIRTILLDTKVKIVPGETNPSEFKSYRVYDTPAGQEWRFPMLLSLLELKESRWQVQFDEETLKISEEEIDIMIANVCTGE